ncbi:trypsin-like peptidase domain-containing protein [Pleurocapsales cyanobacterium LEGE 10410]|nr:trypsin-like peptidase domain-containing protein [Pleurocapsales cyanobacterium LEGE 10410]
MKWLPDKGSRKRNLQGISSVLSIFNSTSQLTRLIICLVYTGVFLSGDVGDVKLAAPTSLSPQRLLDNISHVAAKITVKILDKDLLGSGFIAQRQGQEYIVITNQHVLRAGKAPYKIQTADGQIHSAQLVALAVSDRQYDIAVLKFEADTVYSQAKIGSSLFLEVGEPIFAAGFPYAELDPSPATTVFEPSGVDRLGGLALKPGRITIILDRALEEGYQIAYTNDVKKGMSGGPLFNYRGEVVGINGKHAYPLWESPEIYQDGSQPCPDLQELIARSSLAIPIERSIELSPRLKPLEPSFDSSIEQTILSEPRLVAKMQAEAQATTQNCENFIRESIGNEAIPSLSDRYKQSKKN